MNGKVKGLHLILDSKRWFESLQEIFSLAPNVSGLKISVYRWKRKEEREICEMSEESVKTSSWSLKEVAIYRVLRGKKWLKDGF